MPEIMSANKVYYQTYGYGRSATSWHEMRHRKPPNAKLRRPDSSWRAREELVSP